MNMRVACRTGGVGAALLLACSAPRVVSGNPQAEIAAMLQRSAADWNRGDLAGFMGDYAKDSLTSYVSGGHVQRSEEHTSELQSRLHLVCRLLLEKKKKWTTSHATARTGRRWPSCFSPLRRSRRCSLH